MKALIQSTLSMSLVLAGLMLPQMAQAETPYDGQTCDTKMTDELKCMVCIIYFEARGTGTAGMITNGRSVMTRVRSRQYPNSICGVIKDRNPVTQYPSWQNKRMKERGIMPKVYAAAKKAIAAGPNGFKSFYSRGGKNHYSELQKFDGLASDVPHELAMQEIDHLMRGDLDSQNSGEVETAELLTGTTVR